MKPVFIKKNTTALEFFIFGINDAAEECNFNAIEKVKNNAFQNSSCVKRVYFDEKLKTIEKEAFKNCEELEVFCCGKVSEKKEIPIQNLELNKTIQDDFCVQTSSFSGCKKLQTAIFPECSKLIIEKSAFENCSSLRTVIAIADEISFTDNPFEDCTEELTFICKEGSSVERFARENGYRFKNV